MLLTVLLIDISPRRCADTSHTCRARHHCRTGSTSIDRGPRRRTRRTPAARNRGSFPADSASGGHGRKTQLASIIFFGFAVPATRFASARVRMPIVAAHVESAQAVAPVEWRAIPIAPGYEASSLGTIRNSNSLRVLKPWLAGSGYRYLRVAARSISVHRLVAFAFLGRQPSRSHEVAHNDGDKLNNHISNLRWATHAENQHDIVRHGTGRGPSLKGVTNPRAKLRDHEVIHIRRLINEGKSRRSLAIEAGVSISSIDHIATGRTWKHLS